MSVWPEISLLKTFMFTCEFKKILQLFIGISKANLATDLLKTLELIITTVSCCTFYFVFFIIAKNVSIFCNIYIYMYIS